MCTDASIVSRGLYIRIGTYSRKKYWQNSRDSSTLPVCPWRDLSCHDSDQHRGPSLIRYPGQQTHPVRPPPSCRSHLSHFEHLELSQERPVAQRDDHICRLDWCDRALLQHCLTDFENRLPLRFLISHLSATCKGHPATTLCSDSDCSKPLLSAFSCRVRQGLGSLISFAECVMVQIATTGHRQNWGPNPVRFAVDARYVCTCHH